ENGIFDSWASVYAFQSKALTRNDLIELKQEDSSFIFNRFLEILRHNVVSDKPNAFNKIFTLFLCKIVDEDRNDDEQLHFQWIEGEDNHISFQKRMTDLYNRGMLELLEKKVTDVSDKEFDKRFLQVDDKYKEQFKDILTEIRLKKNNEFAIKEVYDDASFQENAKVVKEVVELLQVYQIRYNYRQQFLSDFFELLLTTGLKQESGQFFTPVPIARFIIKSLPFQEITTQKIKEGNKKDLLPTIIDYATGSGHFITESMEEVQKQIDSLNPKDYIPSTKKALDSWQRDQFDWAEDYVYGIEKDYRLVKTAKVSCYLHGDGLAKVIHGDGLGDFATSKEFKDLLSETDKTYPQDNKQFDIIISNPPYSVSAFKGQMNEEKANKGFELYNKLTDQSKEIESLFIERTKQLLKDGGVAGIILPNTILNKTGIYTYTREIILKYFEIIAITEMGASTFMATDVKTVTLFLRRRNNADWVNLQASVVKIFNNLQDNTINKIEKPVSKYVSHVWEDISFDDYKTLLQKTPNDKIKNHDIYQEYQKKIKAKSEKEKWNSILALEQDKLLYYIIAYPQKVVLIKTGDKKVEKRFLGYDFSDRRGSEGIHSMERGKTIDDCTKLYDENVFDNPKKASTYIYKAFSENKFDLEIDKSLKKNVSYIDLVDTLTFNRISFDKSISLSFKKKVKINSKWDVIRIQDICEIGRGRVINKKEIAANFGEFPVYSSQTSNNGIFGYLNTYDFVGEYATWTTDGIYAGSVFYRNGKFNCTNVCGTLKAKSDIINMKYLALMLPRYTGNYVIKVANPKLMNNVMAEIKIPLPPIKVQEKIIFELEKIETEEGITLEKIEKLREQITEVINASNGSLIRLEKVTSKIGSGATPRGGESAYKREGINLIRSQNVYDKGMIKKGLVFIDDTQAKKLDNVTVKKNDVLFNITGASVCRCCIVESDYLPARVNQHVSIIRANEKISPVYLHHILISPKIKAELLVIAQGSATREAITKIQLEEFKIPVPPINEQQKIVSEIEKIETKIALLEKEIAAIPNQKEAVLKKYL
ncbi:MAG: restriction endonuclease subunit S, partial [Chitinophagales bacterium]